MYEIVLKKYSRYKKQYEEDQRTIKFFDNLYRKSLEDKRFDKNENQHLCNSFIKYRKE